MNRFIAAGFAISFCSSSYAALLEKQFQECRSIQNSDIRLKCFDNLQPEIVDSAQKVSEAEECSDCAQFSAGIETSAEFQLMEKFREKRERQAYYLSTNHPNFFGFAVPIEDKLQDESHGEFYLSIKYPLHSTGVKDSYNSSEAEIGPRWPSKEPDRVFFVYNSLYDFYFTGDRYTSSPVISRQQNVGLQLEWHSANRREKIRAGWMHESNGQVLGEEDGAVFFENQAQFGDDFALSDVSRGWDYILFRYERGSHEYPISSLNSWWDYQTSSLISGWRYHFEVRSYFCECQNFGFSNSEDEIWWDPENNESISDYDGLRFMAETTLRPGTDFALELRADIKSGIHDPLNFGGKLTLGIVKRNFRLTAFYFNGFGKEPSTYHLRTQYFGIGLELR